MSYCRKDGKDELIFVTQEDFNKQSDINPLLPEIDEEPEGLIKANGDINWECPCLQGMADGPCGEPFKEAFSCFHYSDSEPKGVDCLGQFKSMQECFLKYPEIYGSLDDDDESNEENSNSDGDRELKVDESVRMNSNETDLESTKNDLQLHDDGGTDAESYVDSINVES